MRPMSRSNKARPFTSEGRIFLGVIILLAMVGYSSMNWVSSIFMTNPTSKPEDGQQRNVTSWGTHSSYGYHGHSAATYIMDRNVSSTAANLRGNVTTLSSTVTQNHNDASIKSDFVQPSVTNTTLGTVETGGSMLLPNSSDPSTPSLHNVTTPPPSIENSGKNTTRYIELPLPNAFLPPISFTGCCGVGHRLARNIPAMVYAISNSRPLVARWEDVSWNVLFNDTEHIKQGLIQSENYGNDPPENWRSAPLAHSEPIDNGDKFTAYNRYGNDLTKPLFEMPLAHSIAKSLSDNLSPLVLSFLGPMREQYQYYSNKKKSDNNNNLHLCVHVREGNNETGDWEKKSWRHIPLIPTLGSTLASMRSFAEKRNATNVSVFVASDSTKARPWLEANVPAEWTVVKPGKELPRPESGVWFGEYASETNGKLNRTELNEAMAEAVADIFALGECDALYIPSYSSFSIVGIMLARAERKKVFFQWTTKEWIEYPWYDAAYDITSYEFA